MANHSALRNPVRLIREPEVERRTGLPRDRINLEEAAGRFPQRVPLTRRTMAWVESEVDAWVAERVAARDDPVKSEQLKFERAPVPTRERMRLRRELSTAEQRGS
jgi:prophage regulatory protein